MIRFKLDDLSEAQRVLSPKVYTRALKRAATRTLPTAKKIVRDEIRRVYNVKPGKVNQITTTTIVVRGNKTITALRYVGRRLTIGNFSVGKGKIVRVASGGFHRKKKGGGTTWVEPFLTKKRSQLVRIKTKSGAKLLKGGFRASPKKSHTSLIFKREGASRFPIEAVRTLSVPEMIDSTKVLGAIQTRLPLRFRSEVGKAMTHEVSKAIAGLAR